MKAFKFKSELDTFDSIKIRHALGAPCITECLKDLEMVGDYCQRLFDELIEHPSRIDAGKALVLCETLYAVFRDASKSTQEHVEWAIDALLEEVSGE